MNKWEFVSLIAERVGLPRVEVEQLLSSLVSVVKEELENSGKVTLSGFGTFKTVERNAREGRNPKTGQIIQIEAKRVPKFVPSKEFEEKLNH